MAEKPLYDRLGGIYHIAAVVDYFVETLAEDPVAGEYTSNPYLEDWYANRSWRNPGFKVLTTLWICHKAGGPYEYISTIPNDDDLDLKSTHHDMRLTSEEFEAAGDIFAASLDHFDVPEKEKNELMNALEEHKEEVINGTNR